MKWRRTVVALTMCFCVMLGLFTLVNGGFMKSPGIQPAIRGDRREFSGVDSFRDLGWVPAQPEIAAAAQAPVILQLKALKRDDYIHAFEYESRGPTRPVSEKRWQVVIKTYYPELAKYKSIHFGAVFVMPNQDSLFVPAELIAEDGKRIEAKFIVVSESGHFRIAVARVL